MARSTRNSSRVLAACSTTLTRCIPAASRARSGGPSPDLSNWASAISESQRERMPLRRDVTLGKGPGDALAGQAPANVRVLVNVLIVVEVDEVVAGRLAEDGNHRQQQKAADGRKAVESADESCRTRGDAIDGARRGPMLRAFRIAGLRHSLLLASSRHLDPSDEKNRSIASRVQLETGCDED